MAITVENTNNNEIKIGYYEIFNKFNKISNFYNIEIKLENVPFNIDINKLKNSTKFKIRRNKKC